MTHPIRSLPLSTSPAYRRTILKYRPGSSWSSQRLHLLSDSHPGSMVGHWTLTLHDSTLCGLSGFVSCCFLQHMLPLLQTPPPTLPPCQPTPKTYQHPRGIARPLDGWVTPRRVLSGQNERLEPWNHFGDPGSKVLEWHQGLCLGAGDVSVSSVGLGLFLAECLCGGGESLATDSPSLPPTELMISN